MSWMDSWSRPSKSQATPPPLYLTVGDSVPYCHTCGRVISDRKKTSSATEVKYCSSRCRHQKPGPLDRKIEAAFAKLLQGASPESIREEHERAKLESAERKDTEPTSPKKEGEKAISPSEDESPKFAKKPKAPKKKTPKSKPPKGDHRLIIDCTTVEDAIFARPKDPQKVYGRRKNRRPRFVPEDPNDWKSVDMLDKPAPDPRPAPPDTASSAEEYSASDREDEGGGIPLSALLPDTLEYGFGSGKVRPPQDQSSINGSVGGEKGWAERQSETEEAKQRRREGQRRADEREMVRKAARRGCAFGFVVPGEEGKRKCEAVMKGVVVESSFAKGEWGVRWRED